MSKAFCFVAVSVRAEAEVPLLLRAGVVGFQLPSLDVEILPVSAGDTLIFATDGIQSDFARGLARSFPPQKAAEKILARYGKATDDALVLVARYLGRQRTRVSQNLQNGAGHDLERAYARALEDYLLMGGEDALRSAYEIGRTALAEGKGVLAMAAMHHAAIAKVMPDSEPFGIACAESGQGARILQREPFSLRDCPSRIPGRHVCLTPTE